MLFLLKKILFMFLRKAEMADTEPQHIEAVEEDLEAESNYKPPPEKTIEQLLQADAEDESLRKYKETLLGEAKAGGVVVGEKKKCIFLFTL